MSAPGEGMNGHATVVPSMTAEEARACIARARAFLDGARRELLRLYDAEGWRVLGYGSWRACVVAEFGQGERNLYLQLAAARVERRIQEAGVCNPLQNGPIPEIQLRPLARLPEEQWAPAFQAAIDTARDGRIGGPHVAAVVEEFKRRDRLEVHYSSATPEWYTPSPVVAAVLDFFDRIDLDPCAEGGERKTVPAARHFTATDNGLARPWSGRVYMNPPYGDGIGAWVAKLDAHYRAGDVEAGIALVPARTDTAWFRALWPYRICFIYGRLRFGDGPDAAPFPSALVYLGTEPARFAAAFGGLGAVVRLSGQEAA